MYTSFENGGEVKEGMTREEVEADYAGAAQNYVDNEDWGTVESESGVACHLVMSCELVDPADPTDPWKDAEDFTSEDWYEAVQAGNTRLGYLDWVEAQREVCNA